MKASFIWDRTDLSQEIFGENARIAAVAGAGGKSSLLAYLAQKESSTPILLTTTTRMAWMQRTLAASWQCVDDPWPDELFAPLLMIDRVQDNKLIGIEDKKVCELANRYSHARVIYEADGAARGDLKCPGPHEPVIAACTDVMIVITSVQALGQPLNSIKIHRRNAFDTIIPPQMQDRNNGKLTPHLMSCLLEHPDGAFRHCPSDCRRLWLLNKADLCDRQSIQTFVEKMLPYRLNLDGIILGSLKEGWFDRLQKP